MRIRITQLLKGRIDDIQLSRFQAGETYDVGNVVGSHFLAEHVAVPVEEHLPTNPPCPACRCGRTLRLKLEPVYQCAGCGQRFVEPRPKNLAARQPDQHPLAGK